MATQTYCSISDVYSIMGTYFVTRSLDDDEDATLSAAESAYGDTCISIVASQMNSNLYRRYKADELVSSEWCKFCNMILVAPMIAKHRGNAAPQALEDEAERYRAWLKDIRYGRMNLPDTPLGVDPTPGTSNYSIDMAENQPVRVDTEISRRDSADGVKRNTKYY